MHRVARGKACRRRVSTATPAASSDSKASAIAGLVDRGLLEESDTAIRPTAEGFYLNNEIGLALIG